MVDYKQLAKDYPGLFEDVSRLIFLIDPIDINGVVNSEEYEPEVAAILPMLKDTTSEKDIFKLVCDVFIRFFGDSTANINNKEELYRGIARGISNAWWVYKNKP